MSRCAVVVVLIVVERDRAAEPREARGYVRPHEFEIERTVNGVPMTPAKVVHINPVGAVTRVQLLAEEQELVVNAELSPERYAELGLQVGDTVYVAPRRVRVFAQEPDYSI